jgi:hypothetical protein
VLTVFDQRRWTCYNYCDFFYVLYINGRTIFLVEYHHFQSFVSVSSDQEYIFIPPSNLYNVMIEVVKGIDTYTKASYVY